MESYTLNLSIKGEELMGKKAKIIYLILGIGIGFVISSTFYSFFPVTKYVELNDDIIIERARELGMVPLKESIDLENMEANEENVDNDNTSEPIDENQIDKIDDGQEEPYNDAEGNSHEDKLIKLVVKKGEKLSDIANSLFELGLIDNVEEFKSFVRENGYGRLLHYGEFEIKENSSYSDILKILTHKK